MKGALSLAVVVLATFATAPAEAAFPGTNGQIAFEQGPPDVPAIAAANGDGSGFHGLPIGPEGRDPSWSPDGRRLAFTSRRDGNEEIYVLDLANGAVTRLTFDPARDHDPAFSPDGSQIAFVSERDGNGEIYVMPSAGGPAQRITDDPADDRQPAWSNTNVIAFASDRIGGDHELFTMDPQGGNVRQVTSDPGLADLDPSWSPDGTKLAFARQSGAGWTLTTIGADGQGLAQVPGTGYGHLPAWSPDGTQIAYAGPGPQIDVVLAGGGIPQPVAGGVDPNWAPLPPPTPPTSGATLNLTPTSAQVLVAPSTNTAPSTNPADRTQLRGGAQVPVGTTVDATLGTVGLDAVTHTPEGPGNVGHADITFGVFSITQASGGDPTLRLLASPPPCSQASAAVADARLRMRVKARGRFRTVGGYGSAAGHGTEWITRNRCDGTSFKVVEDAIDVFDNRRHKTVTVKAGQCYLAAAVKRKDATRPHRKCPKIRRHA